jgi:hypothetical protein
VVSEAVTSLRRNHDTPRLYLPIAPSNLWNARMVVAVPSELGAVVVTLRDALRAVDSGADVVPSLVRDRLADERAPSRSLALLALLISGTAVSLACIGLFGLTAFAVAERRHEVSIRMALGATAGQAVALVMRENLTPVVAGLAVGLVVALFLGQVLQSVLYGIGARDPIALASAVVLLLLAAMTATFIPARRVTRVDPLVGLKTL